MLDVEKLRKADVFSGFLVILLGCFIISQALQMPMKDSYGGVQNVWYVSPALFPLLVGGTLVLLGSLLMRTALRTIGVAGVKSVFRFLAGSTFLTFLKEREILRFYGIVLNLLILVFILVPRVDFFISATAFLFIFFAMFYCLDERYLTTIISYLIGGTIVLCLLLFTPLAERLAPMIGFPADYLLMIMLGALMFWVRKTIGLDPDYRRKYYRCLIIALAGPFIIGVLFKYFLLVPMPFEGAVVYLLDAIWYADFWS
ncbi:MAG: hypothetical protein D6B25_10210 [Desulfobulbaceae bacterium]|nr:MAG: hypothetical protein D6B25_10210 [Desulfobulbaceae bacterium]